MARFVQDPGRLNYVLPQSGKEFQTRLLQRAQGIFGTLLKLLASNYVSGVQGPSYTMELKAMAVEMARLELSLEDVNSDRSLPETRSELLYQVMGYLLFLNGKLPPAEFDDQEFKAFLIAVLDIYFKGSVPLAIRETAALFLTGDVSVTENFLLIRQGASGFDISDQFGFQIDLTVPEGGALPQTIFDYDASLRLLLNIVRPAHTLFRIRYIFQDTYAPNGPSRKILDEARWSMASYYYDDLRRYVGGVRDRDRLGVKVNEPVTDENHSADFLGPSRFYLWGRQGVVTPMTPAPVQPGTDLCETVTLKPARALIEHRRPTRWLADGSPDPTSYVLLSSEESTNLIILAGVDFLHAQGYGTSAGANGLNYIALSNDTVTETNASTTLSSEIVANGLSRAQGVVAHTPGASTTTVTYTFTCATSAQAARKAALFSAASSGSMNHVLAFTQRSLQVGDTLAVSFQITLS